MPSAWISMVTGHCARDPEMKTVGQSQVCEVSIPINKGPRDNQSTTWWRISIWGKPGEWLYNDAQKGSVIHAIGEQENREYTKRDGSLGYSVELKAWKVTVLAGRREQGQQPQRPPQHQERSYAPGTGAGSRYGGPGQPALEPSPPLPRYQQGGDYTSDDGLPF